jgi:putative phosphonate metabolism protein
LRYALYFTPAPGSALARFGAESLGYDADGGAVGPPAPVPGLGAESVFALTEEPRLYGFHATLKAPIRLAGGATEQELLSECRRFAESRPAVPVGRLEVRAIGPFLALVPRDPPPELGLFAAECVAHFDPFRAPLTEAERDRRIGAGLTPRQVFLLERWGYPHVFELFRFHMTLTGRLPDERRGPWRDALVERFGPLQGEAVTIDALALLRQAPGERFRVVERFPLTGAVP